MFLISVSIEFMWPAVHVDVDVGILHVYVEMCLCFCADVQENVSLKCKQ